MRCSFCGHEFPPGTGMMYISNDGSAMWFCSSKCRKNVLNLKRDARKFKWTDYYGKEAKTKT
jgi:large subunit ribosomal protein L24e